MNNYIGNTLPTAPQPKRLRITRKVKAAIALMIEDGTPWNDAAVKVGLSTRAMRYALEKHHVLRYLREQKQVFRERIAAANPRRLAQLRDQDENRAAAVRAVLALEEIGEIEERALSSPRFAPGLVVVITSSSGERVLDPRGPRVVEASASHLLPTVDKVAPGDADH